MTIFWKENITSREPPKKHLFIDAMHVFSHFAGSQLLYLTARVSAACVIILAAYHMIKEVIWIFFSKKTYFLHVQNYAEWVLCITAILFVVFVFINHCGCPTKWQWQVGIASVFLGWLNLIFMTSNIPVISIYAIMFRDIFITFSKLVIFAVLLISAFSLILYMMFHNPTHSAKVHN